MSERVTQAMFATIDGYAREPNDRQVTLGFRTVDEASAFLSFISEVKHTWTALAARPASAEKIASVVRAWPWPEQRAQLEAMLVRTEAYTTPPAAAQDRERLERMAVYVGHGKRTRDGMCGRCFDHGLATGFVCAWHDAMDVLHEMAYREDAANAAGATDGK